MKRLFTLLVTVCFLVVPGCAGSQNLVPNPDFEEYLQCPDALGEFGSLVESWTTPTDGTTDYFNECGANVVGVPRNFNGEQGAYSGKSYAGMYFYAPDDYREYLQVPLKRNLEKGREYHLSFFLSWAEGSDFVLKDIGIMFSAAQIRSATKNTLTKRQLYAQTQGRFWILEVSDSRYWSGSRDWMSVSTDFVAQGNEAYLLIGNFRTNRKTRKHAIRPNAHRGAYYYLDAISLTTLKENETTASDVVWTPGNAYRLEGLRFKFDSFKLDSIALRNLDELYGYLMENDSIGVAIHGYTDATGTTPYNKNLSAKRAKSVVDYLLGLGLSPDRVKWYGHGSEDPLGDNATEEGRDHNRRVEFVILGNTD